MFSEENFKILNSLPLVEVMRGWGHTPKHNAGKAALFLCPWHDDHRPSLTVDKEIKDGATDLGFYCGPCGRHGYGALQLAAQLDGMKPGKVPDEDVERLLNELATRCDVELQPESDSKPGRDPLRKHVIGWDEFKATEPQYDYLQDKEAAFEPGTWTEEALRALGLKVELATEKAKKAELDEYLSISKDDTAAAKVGDMVTEFDPDSGLPLYRCSLGTGFYRGAKKAEKHTIEDWGKMLEQQFGVKPISRFLQRRRKEDTGGVIVLDVRATKNYPIFIFEYSWGIKKYEPKDIYGKNKWTWYNMADEADLYHQWYADRSLDEYLRDGVVPENDPRHPFAKAKDDDDEQKDKKKAPPKFKRIVICSGPRDAIAVWSHTDAHVMWLHSEQAGFDRKGGNVRPNRWLRSLLKKLQGIVADGGLYVCYDEDATGLASSQAIALNNPQVRWLRLPKELGQIVTFRRSDVQTADKKKPKPLKDVTDLVTRFQDVEDLMPADLQHDDPVEWFDNALYDTPTCQFWQWESERKEKDGSSRARYKFDLRNTPVFLRARGLVRRVMQGEKNAFSRFFLLGNDNTYTEWFPGEKGSNKLVAQARDMMAEWLRAHREFNDEKGALSRAIYSAKLETSILETVEQADFDEHSYGEDFDYFFFENTAVRVTSERIDVQPYNQLHWWTNRDAIMDGSFQSLPQLWHVVVNPLYEPERIKHEEIMAAAKTPEERAQENMRWDGWQQLWHYLLKTDKPIEEMPMHFQFLHNTSRIFWEKEQTGELTKTEKQVQDMYLIAMLHAIGSLLVRHRSANRQQFVHITDNGTRREDLASGGTGKTAIMELLSLVRRVLQIDGKALEGSNIILEQELGKVIPGLHNIVALDELPAGFSPKKMYNLPLSVTSRGMYRESVVLRGDDLPKFVIASNEQIDLSSDSTSRRTYQLLVSDWYHPRSMDGSRPAHTPADDFRKDYGIKEVARNLPPALLNEARNLLLGCAQLFFQLPDETLIPPKDSRAMLRQALAASKDEQFTRWISGYLADKRHLGIPIAQRELAISLLDYCGITVGEKTMKGAYKRIRDNMEEYLRTSIYVVNPHVVLLKPTDRDNGSRQCPAWQYPKGPDGFSIALDEKGNRLPRERKQSKTTYYFYKKSKIPRNFYDPAHIGDPDYVQPAPDTDPEAE